MRRVSECETNVNANRIIFIRDWSISRLRTISATRMGLWDEALRWQYQVNVNKFFVNIQRITTTNN